MSDALKAFWFAAEFEEQQRRKRKLKASERCVEKLAELGVTDAHVRPNRGYWSHRTQDCYRWEFFGKYQGVSCVGGCYQSMTYCAKTSVALRWLEDWLFGEIVAVEK